MQVRDRSGKILTVTEAKGKELLATGQYQLVAPAPRTSSGSSGGGTRTVKEDPYDPSIADNIGTWIEKYLNPKNLIPNMDVYVPSGPGLFTAPPAYWPGMPANRTSTNVDETGGFVHGYDWQLSSAEQLQADNYMKKILANPEQWWQLDTETPGIGFADGQEYSYTQIPLRMSQWNLENNLEELGFSDRVIREVSRQFDAQTVNPNDGTLSVNPDFDTSLGGGGGGGGASGPKYIAPMRTVVEDTVKTALRTLVGEADPRRVQELANQYEDSHRAQYDVRYGNAGDRDIDPNQVLLDTIRSQDDYKRVHALRGEADDEMAWIGERRSRLSQLGLNSGDADERAIALAQSGTALPDIETGAFQNSKGRKDITMMNTIQAAAQQVAGSL